MRIRLLSPPGRESVQLGSLTFEIDDNQLSAVVSPGGVKIALRDRRRFAADADQESEGVPTATRRPG